MCFFCIHFCYFFFFYFYVFICNIVRKYLGHEKMREGAVELEKMAHFIGNCSILYVSHFSAEVVELSRAWFESGQKLQGLLKYSALQQTFAPQRSGQRRRRIHASHRQTLAPQLYSFQWNPSRVNERSRTSRGMRRSKFKRAGGGRSPPYPFVPVFKIRKIDWD